jgi:serine/threonine protein kinase
VHLHTAFEKPLIHRDIKSANILLDHQLVPKVMERSAGNMLLVGGQNVLCAGCFENARHNFRSEFLIRR